MQHRLDRRALTGARLALDATSGAAVRAALTSACPTEP